MIWAADLGRFYFLIPLNQLAKQEQYSSNLVLILPSLGGLSCLLVCASPAGLFSLYFLIKIPLAPERDSMIQSGLVFLVFFLFLFLGFFLSVKSFCFNVASGRIAFTYNWGLHMTAVLRERGLLGVAEDQALPQWCLYVLFQAWFEALSTPLKEWNGIETREFTAEFSYKHSELVGIPFGEIRRKMALSEGIE